MSPSRTTPSRQRDHHLRSSVSFPEIRGRGRDFIGGILPIDRPPASPSRRVGEHFEIGWIQLGDEERHYGQ
jgi:hypothetical protein